MKSAHEEKLKRYRAIFAPGKRPLVEEAKMAMDDLCGMVERLERELDKANHATERAVLLAEEKGKQMVREIEQIVRKYR